MSDDRHLLELIDEHSQPKPMSRAQQVAFRHAVEERLERRSAMPWRTGLALAATAAMAAAIWLASGPSPANAPVEVVREQVPAAPLENGRAQEATEIARGPEVEETKEARFLASFADPDEALEIDDDYLPDDYMVLASMVDELDA
jgi:hypothetical protein